MRLPGGKDIELSRHRKHVMRHPRAEGLDVPLLGSMKTELTVKAVGIDLRRNLQKDHAGKAAAMGVGGVVITSFLTVQPKIDGLQVIAARDPWATALGGWRSITC